MGAVLEAVGVLGILALVGALVWTIVSTRNAPPDAAAVSTKARPVPDRHQHRWTKWQVIDERRIHLYGEVDEGRELPDRIDVVLRRECVRCGLPQTQTVRGLDQGRRF